MRPDALHALLICSLYDLPLDVRRLLVLCLLRGFDEGEQLVLEQVYESSFNLLPSRFRELRDLESDLRESSGLSEPLQRLVDEFVVVLRLDLDVCLRL